MIYATEITIFKDSINQGWLDLFNRSLTSKEENFGLDCFERYLNQGLKSDSWIVELDEVNPGKLRVINRVMKAIYLQFNLK